MLIFEALINTGGIDGITELSIVNIFMPLDYDSFVTSDGLTLTYTGQ